MRVPIGCGVLPKCRPYPVSGLCASGYAVLYVPFSIGTLTMLPHSVHDPS